MPHLHQAIRDKLKADKDHHKFGQVELAIRDSTRSVNMHNAPRSPRLANVLNMLMTYPERRHIILVPDGGRGGVVIANTLAHFRRVVLGTAPETRQELYYDLDKRVVRDPVTSALITFHRCREDYDTLLLPRYMAGLGGFSVDDPNIVLSSCVDLEEKEARQFAHRYRPRDGNMNAPEDVRLCLFLETTSSRQFVARTLEEANANDRAEDESLKSPL